MDYVNTQKKKVLRGKLLLVEIINSLKEGVKTSKEIMSSLKEKGYIVKRSTFYDALKNLKDKDIIFKIKEKKYALDPYWATTFGRVYKLPQEIYSKLNLSGREWFAYHQGYCNFKANGYYTNKFEEYIAAILNIWAKHVANLRAINITTLDWEENDKLQEISIKTAGAEIEEIIKELEKMKLTKTQQYTYNLIKKVIMFVFQHSKNRDKIIKGLRYVKKPPLEWWEKLI